MCVGVRVFVCVEGSGHEGRWWRGWGGGRESANTAVLSV